MTNKLLAWGRGEQPARAPIEQPTAYTGESSWIQPDQSDQGDGLATRVVGTIVLLPFAVALDVVGGALYVVATVLSVFSQFTR